MLTFLAFLALFIFLSLWYHGAIFLPDAQLEVLKGFTFIYKEHQTSYNKLGPIYNELIDILKKKAKGLNNYVASGKLSFHK